MNKSYKSYYRPSIKEARAIRDLKLKLKLELELELELLYRQRSGSNKEISSYKTKNQKSHDLLEIVNK